MKFRTLQEKDALFMLEWMHDEEINKYFCFDMASQTEDSVISYIRNSWDDENNRHFAVTDDKDIYQGTVSLKNIDDVHRKAEYAISLRKNAQGKGYAHFATSSILDYAFNELNLNRVYLNVLDDNKRANRFYQKYGFIYEGTSREGLHHRGKYHNLNWYSMLRSEYNL